MRSGSLSSRLLSTILPVSFLGILAVALSTYLIAREVILWEAQQGIAAVTESAAAQVRGYFEQRRSDLATVSRSPLFKDHYLNVEYGLDQEAEIYRREIGRMLLDLARRTGAYPRLSYLDASGKEVCLVEDGRIAGPAAASWAREHFDSLARLRTGQSLVSPILRVPWHGPPVVVYGTALRDPEKRPRGALMFAVSLGPVYDSLGRLHLGISGRSYLSARSSGRLRQDQPSSGRGMLTSAAAIPGTPWSVVTAVHRKDFTEHLAGIGTLTLFLSLFASMALVLIITRQVRMLLGPLRALAGAAQSYAGGDLEARVDVPGPSDISLLADSFNLMADRLKVRAEDLLQRVRELTALQSMNETVLRQLGRGAAAKACLEAVIRGLDFERGILYLVDEGRGEIVGECVYGMERVGLSDAQIKSRRIALGSGHVLAEVVRTRASIFVEDAGSDPRCDREFAARLQGRSFCAAPVIVRERVRAVLNIGFDVPDRSIPRRVARNLPLFCGAVGLALENAQLFDALVESEAHYRTAVENSPHAMVGLDQNFRVTLWNRRAEVLFGYPPAEAFGRTLELVFGPEAYKRLERRVQTEGVLRHVEVPGLSREGRRLDINLSLTGQSAGPSGALEWFAVMQDETEKKRLRAQLAEAEKLTAAGNLIAGVAHELNNPLAAVVGFAEVLKDLPAGPEEREDLRCLHQSALRCRDIVAGLLLFVRKGKAARHRLSLNYVVQAALGLFEYRMIKADGIRLDVELAPGLPEVAGEFQKIEQVLVNILSNACDVLRGRPDPRVIAVRTRVREGRPEVEIEDNGPGVPPELRRRIFEPFFTTKPAGQGTGLGLSISAQIVAEFGGELLCEEVRGGGARFSARFPPCPQDLPEPDSVMKLPPSMPGRRVLVVDDEPGLAQLMLRLLAEDGLIAGAAADPRHGLRRLREEEFDLLIADIGLGPFKGTDLVQEARKLPRPPAFILVTGDVLNQSWSRELLDLRVPILSKPFLRTEFLRVVRRVLQDLPSLGKTS